MTSKNAQRSRRCTSWASWTPRRSRPSPSSSLDAARSMTGGVHVVDSGHTAFKAKIDPASVFAEVLLLIAFIGTAARAAIKRW